MELKEENSYTPNCIRTFAGIYVNVFDPTPEMFTIEDIAHSLSMQPRFGGHYPVFYSVADHCLNCAHLIKERELKLCALLHDASEAYLLDLPKPIKMNIPQYNEIEDKLMKVIAAKFDFPYPLPQAVKDIDKQMLEWEWDMWMRKETFMINKRTHTKLDFRQMAEFFSLEIIK